ncbi:unnamed protein product [Linum tenue]|uniref:Cyanobacterial aminoacyl-tRNA synthetase CAAD domain-containing protein n=1 Tax=Linum tenue TaxID=586396 RepID=A0AAV0PGT0_9ROSI|nr:unnamed protein product [Linum tenue]
MLIVSSSSEAESSRVSLLQTRATSSDESSVDTSEIFTDLKEKWDAVENKSTVLVYGGGAIVAVWLSSILVGAINSVPLVSRSFRWFAIIVWMTMVVYISNWLFSVFVLQTCSSLRSWSWSGLATPAGLSTDTSCSSKAGKNWLQILRH